MKRYSLILTGESLPDAERHAAVAALAALLAFLGLTVLFFVAPYRRAD